MAILPREPLKFERQDCTRCGGSGRYSFNLMDGDRCFGCAGKGVTLTKRGAAAQKWMRERMEVAAEFVKVGDRVRLRGFATFTVREIVHEATGSISLKNNGQGMKNFCWSAGPSARVQLVLAPEDHVKLLTEALEYEATLGVSGKPLKRRTAA
jgi:hypothetical protein